MISLYKIRSLLLLLLKKYIDRVFNKKNVFVFSGLRRGGNHACISWLNNAIAKGDYELSQVGHKVFWCEASGVLHLNEVNFISLFEYFLFVKNNRDKISKANYVFLSLEDYVPEKSSFYFPKNAKLIKISRGVLALLSSRLAYNIKRAKDGIDRGDMHIDQPLFDMWGKLEGPETWYYESWFEGKEWRQHFLERLELEADIMPELTNHGGGSSFHGKDKKSVIKMTEKERWGNVQWPDRVLTLLKDNKHFLKNSELHFLQKNFPELF